MPRALLTTQMDIFNRFLFNIICFLGILLALKKNVAFSMWFHFCYLYSLLLFQRNQREAGIRKFGFDILFVILENIVIIGSPFTYFSCSFDVFDPLSPITFHRTMTWNCFRIIKRKICRKIVWRWQEKKPFSSFCPGSWLNYSKDRIRTGRAKGINEVGKEQTK